MADTNINKIYASSGTRTKWTWSFWLKRGTITNGDQVISTCHLDNSNQDVIRFGSADDKLDWWSYQSDSYSNGGRLQTNRVFRDCNAWYHIVLRWDSSNNTAGDRMKMWINGVEETSFATDTNPTSGRESLFNYGNNSQTWKIGSGNNTQYFDGSLSHIHFCDNYLYQASDFGSTDSTTGEWKINTSPNVQYGTNGYTILKDGNTITDQSANSNNWSAGTGTLTKTEDCPSNVFATLNPLIYESRSNTFSNGNLKITGGVAGDWSTHYGVSTLGMSSGKYYVEAKITTAVGSQAMLGIIKTSQALSGSLRDIGTACIDAGGRISGGGSDFQTGLTSFASGDIAGAAFDATNGTIQFYRNGSAYGNAISSIASDTYYFATNSYDTGAVVEFNFGNGYFGTTAVATNSGNGYAGAEGSSIFNYQPPTGYTALSTKGLNL